MSEERVAVRSLGNLSMAMKDSLAAVRVFFGHQSVGANIIAGVEDLVRSDPTLRLKVIEWRGGELPAGGLLAHANIGQNGQPAAKTDDFAARIGQAAVAGFDVAFHKFCYIDISERTDVHALFSHYRDTMARLHSAHPQTIFVHMTVPLTHVQYGPKALIKKLMGRAPGGYADNLRREQFNDLMRAEYKGRRPLFDLALVESTRLDGSEERVVFKGQRGRALFSAYASDGRHLNEAGRKRVAEELVVFLAELVSWTNAQAPASR